MATLYIRKGPMTQKRLRTYDSHGTFKLVLGVLLINTCTVCLICVERQFFERLPTIDRVVLIDAPRMEGYKRTFCAFYFNVLDHRL